MRAVERSAAGWRRAARRPGVTRISPSVRRSSRSVQLALAAGVSMVIVGRALRNSASSRAAEGGGVRAAAASASRAGPAARRGRPAPALRPRKPVLRDERADAVEQHEPPRRVGRAAGLRLGAGLGARLRARRGWRPRRPPARSRPPGGWGDLALEAVDLGAQFIERRRGRRGACLRSGAGGDLGDAAVQALCGLPDLGEASGGVCARFVPARDRPSAAGEERFRCAAAVARPPAAAGSGPVRPGSQAARPPPTAPPTSPARKERRCPEAGTGGSRLRRSRHGRGSGGHGRRLGPRLSQDGRGLGHRRSHGGARGLRQQRQHRLLVRAAARQRHRRRRPASRLGGVLGDGDVLQRAHFGA